MMYREEEEVAMEVMAEVVMAKVNDTAPGADQKQVMVADSAEEGILPSNTQQRAKSTENVQSVGLRDPRVRTTTGSTIVTKVKANTMNPRIVTRNSMR